MQPLWLLFVVFTQPEPSLMTLSGVSDKRQGIYGAYVAKERCQQEIVELRQYKPTFESGVCVKVEKYQ